MKEKRPVYIYHNREFIEKANSITEAADKTNVTFTTVLQIAKKQRGTTRKGYYYSYNQLTEEELNELPIRENKNNDNNEKGCIQKVDKQRYEVNCTDKKITYQPKSRLETIETLKLFLYLKLQERWMKIPQNLATLERTYIRETLNSLL